MNITLKQVRTFVTIAQSKSFAEAGDILHLSQPALSISMKNLEETIGGKLLARSTRTLSLTPEGKLFFPVAKRLLTDFDDAFIELSELFSLKRGNLSLAAMPSFASTHLPQHLLAFTEKYQEIKVRVHDVIAEEAVAMVQTGKVEFAISFDPGEFDDLNFETLFSDQLLAVFPEDHALAQADALVQGDDLTWQQLSQYPFIALQRPSSIRMLMENTLAEQELFLQIKYESNQLATVVQMVANKLGVSAIPSLYKQQIQALKIKHSQLTSPTISRRVGIITRKRYPLSQSAQFFVKLLRQHYQ
jgi:LysR family carnitine catabolism transcriptional activator